MMTVDVWADIVCPYCGLGRHRLEQAVAAFEHRDQIQIRHHSFQIAGELSPSDVLSVADFLEHKRGLPKQQSRAVGERLEQSARAEGLAPFHVVENNVGNTALAHQLLAFASAQGKHTEAWRLLFEAYFGRAAPLWTVDDLLPFARELGLDVDQASAALNSHAFLDEVEQDQKVAAAMGARGVPFFVIDERVGVMGAQPKEALLAALGRAWESRVAVP